MSTLKVNKLRDTAGSADAIVLDPNGGAVLAGVTTISTASITTANVGAAVTISESGIEATGVGITCANINGTQIGGRRNIIINGAMNVAQRNTSSTSSGYHTVDRFGVINGGTDEAPTQQQATLTSAPGPYREGHRKAYKITNGNQTSGAGEGDYVIIQYFVEAQDIATSGWDYTSSSSFITLSFWVKSSVAQNFYGSLRSIDGTSQNYPYETGSLTADTWTKVTKTIPGNSNLAFDNDNGQGLRIRLALFRGTNATGSVTLNQWAAFDNSVQYPNNTSTWYETNDSTFFITGVQLEVGSQATAFEHRSFAEELTLCQRYFTKTYDQDSYAGTAEYTGAFQQRSGTSSASALFSLELPVLMRTTPTVVTYGTTAATNASGKIRGSGDAVITPTVDARTSSRTIGLTYTPNQSNTYASGHYTADAEL